MNLSDILGVNVEYTYNKDKISDKIFNFVYGYAMHDAVLQLAFKGKKNWIVNVDDSKSYLREYINHILYKGFKSQDEHDSIFINTANKICQAINNNSSAKNDIFSFGNAQKLINIMTKHIYSFCYYKSRFRKKFRYCHCPLDSIMLKEVWKRYEKSMGKEKQKEFLKNKSFFCKAWGNEGLDKNQQPILDKLPERYLKYQIAIREIIGKGNLYPIEFDYMFWK